MKCVVAILDSQNRREGWGKIEISSKGVVDRREEGGGRGRKKKNCSRLSLPTPPCPLCRNQT